MIKPYISPSIKCVETSTVRALLDLNFNVGGSNPPIDSQSVDADAKSRSNYDFYEEDSQYYTKYDISW